MYESGRLDPCDLDLIDARPEATSLRLGEESRLPRIAVLAREPVGCKPPDWRWLPNEDATAVFCDDSPLGTELLNRLSRRHPCHAVVILELRLGRKPISGPELTGVDRGAKLIGDLPVWRPIVQPIDAAELHTNTSSRPGVP